jgi:hypothetical protein
VWAFFLSLSAVARRRTDDEGNTEMKFACSMSAQVLRPASFCCCCTSCTYLALMGPGFTLLLLLLLLLFSGYVCELALLGWHGGARRFSFLSSFFSFLRSSVLFTFSILSLLLLWVWKRKMTLAVVKGETYIYLWLGGQGVAILAGRGGGRI